MAHTFHILVVGCGGGPSETNLSSYLLKPANKTWAQGVIALEAGSGIGATKKIMRKHPEVFGQMAAVELYSYIRGFLVTHGHLDHVSGLVLSAGAMKGPRKRIWSTKDTLKDLESGVFSDRLWPNLASWKESDPAFMLLYTALPLTTYHPLGCNMSVRTMPVSHGSNALGTYTSAAFFIRHDPSSREFLFFGDVEPDSLAATPLTHRVWLEAAPKIVAGSLSAIFLECSWPSGRPDALLYGHLTPEHFTYELSVLASEVMRLSQHQNGSTEGPARKLRRASIPAILARNRKRADATISPVLENVQGALAGIQIYVTHCKDDLEENYDQSIQKVIAGQIRALVDQAALGCEIVAVEQGTLLAF